MRAAHTRRVFIGGAAATLASVAANLRKPVDAVDHLLLGVSDLDRGIAWVEERTGVRAVTGGSHPGRGTRNALLSLGQKHYLEIIAPDPAQSTFNFQIDIRGLTEPRLITWAAAAPEIDSVATAAQTSGLKTFGPADGSRKTPSGKMLRWRSFGVVHRLAQGGVDPVPFFIQWAAGSEHPSHTSPKGCELQSLALEHPDSAALNSVLKNVGIDAAARKGPAARLVATLKTRKGSVELS